MRTTLLMCAMMCGLSACALGLTTRTATNEPVASEYCRIAKPIRYNSKLDSPATVAAIQAHDSQWVCVCEGDCPKEAPATPQK